MFSGIVVCRTLDAELYGSGYTSFQRHYFQPCVVYFHLEAREWRHVKGRG